MDLHEDDLKVEMVPNAAGILVPKDSIQADEPACTHDEVVEKAVKRFTSNRDVHHCHNCDEKVEVRVVQFGAKTKEEWDLLDQMFREAQALHARQEAEKRDRGEVSA